MDCQINAKQANDLTKNYGSPLYIFHLDEFKKNYMELLDTIRTYYPKYNIAYSYKTNYTPRICMAVKALGGLAEVVSAMEYNLAKKIGYDNKDIIYNGPVKGEGLFEQLIKGGVVNIDSLDEMISVVQLAKDNPDNLIRIAFRVNIDIGQGFISRFGLDAYEEDTEDQDSELCRAFLMANETSNISVVGLHCHIGRSRSLDAWKNRIRIMFKLVDRYFDSIPEFIDLGSGMNSVMEPELAVQFGANIPSFKEYAEIIGNAMAEKYGSLPGEKQPMLYTEPGTTLISGCMSFLAQVQTIKEVKGKTYVTFNCSGGNLGDICHLKNLPISIFHIGTQTRHVKGASFVGYTCLEHDHMYEGFEGELSVGDIVQFRNIGSYSNVFKPPFILPNCAMIELDSEEHTNLIKRKETIDDLFQTYVF